MPEPRSLDDITILALTIFGEARGQSNAGREAVANVILNRLDLRESGIGPRNWGNTLQDVCLAPLQFSAWNEGDPNRAKMLALAFGDAKPDKAYNECRALAGRMLAGQLSDNTNSADHYLVSSIANRTKWAKGKKPVAVIGAHSFYKFYSVPDAEREPPRDSQAPERQDAGASPPVAPGRTIPPEPAASPIQPATQPRALPTAPGALSRQPDEPPPEPDDTVRPWTASKRIKAGTTLVLGSQIPGWVNDLWETFSDWFKNDPVAVETLWSHAVTLLAIKWVGYAIFAGGAAWLVWTFFLDRRAKG